jgi:hypothetical protein
MSDDRPADALATIKQARAQLELNLGENPHWRDLARATLPANRAALERALAGNAVFHAWELLVRLIGDMEAASATAPAQALTEPPARQPRVELRQVLERIRAEPPVDTIAAPAGAAASPGADAGSAQSAPASRRREPLADIDIEEATVSFIVREPLRRDVHTTQREAPARMPVAEAPDPQATPRPAAHDAATTCDDADDAEVEVTIVRR